MLYGTTKTKMGESLSNDKPKNPIYAALLQPLFSPQTSTFTVQSRYQILARYRNDALKKRIGEI